MKPSTLCSPLQHFSGLNTCLSVLDLPRRPQAPRSPTLRLRCLGAMAACAARPSRALATRRQPAVPSLRRGWAAAPPLLPPRQLPPQPARTATLPCQPRACRRATRRPAGAEYEEKSWRKIGQDEAPCQFRACPVVPASSAEQASNRQAPRALLAVTRASTPAHQHAAAAFIAHTQPFHLAATLLTTAFSNAQQHGNQASMHPPACGRWRTCARPGLPSCRRATLPRTGRPWGSGTRLAPPSGCCATRLQVCESAGEPRDG